MVLSERARALLSSQRCSMHDVLAYRKLSGSDGAEAIHWRKRREMGDEELETHNGQRLLTSFRDWRWYLVNRTTHTHT